jgi:ABC-type glycerol-3-phosphate transport system substrate-binding protein
MVTPELYWKQRDKMIEMPYASYPVTTFTASYMDIGKTYLTPTGVAAYPLFVDPLVGYWNKDMFASAGYATPPQEWKEFPELTKKLSVVSDNFAISRSAFALGEYANINHAKEILSLLFMQAGDPITHVGSSGRLALDLGTSAGAKVALDFYTQFADPSKGTAYTWNKSFTSDTEQFLSSDLAYYFGLGSELSTLRRTNPNLNFDMTSVPQADKSGAKLTYGRLYGLAIAKQTKVTPLAYFVINNLLSSANSAKLVTGLQKTGLSVAPVRRDILPNDPANPYSSMLYQAALVSRTWIDPSPAFTGEAWNTMVSDIQSGKSNSSSALNTAKTKMSAYLKTE